MNQVCKDQLKLSYKRYYDKEGMVDVRKLQQANFMLTKITPQKKSDKLLSHIITSRKPGTEDYDNQYIQYEELEQRINSFVAQKDDEDQTGKQLIFQLLDKDADGVLNLEDLMMFLREVGSTMDQKDIIELLQLMTAQGTCLTKKEFLLILKNM